jgi:RHS repeat-associated protein
MQDINYTNDPVGNITRIIDKAVQTIYFNNAAVDPGNEYTYDAVYRLIYAQGREHAGQNKASDQFDTDKTQDGSGARLVLPGDMNAMQRYEQRYQYDPAGNMLSMIHNAGNGVFTNRWTRGFTYHPNNNQLAFDTVSGNTTNYSYDAHGNMLNLQNGSYILTWNYADQLQKVDLGGGGTAYYVYDITGQRVRKIIENGGLVKERIYLPGYEVYSETQGSAVQLRRETLHVMDSKSRIALIETRTEGSDNGLGFLIRYQYGNHLGSSCLELEGTLNSADSSFIARILSFEEYPYGSTAYQAMDNQTETAKRYRYTGMERDDESGMNYHGARYYVPWLARWLNCDPIGIRGGINLYEYVKCNPIAFLDSKGTDPVGPGSVSGYGTIPSRPWNEIVNEALYGPPEYTPKLNISKSVLTAEDKTFEGTQGARFKKLVQDAASKVGLDPGFLAAALLAEESRGSYTKTSGEQDTFTIGSDDYVNKKPEIDRRIPAAKEIEFTSITTDFNEQGREVKTGHFDATKAVLVNAIYLKFGELKVRDVFAKHGVDFESLTPELRFAFTRLAMNPGKNTVESQIEKFLASRDIADTAPGILIRTGVKSQDARKPQSGATLVAARGLHLSQKIFGNVYEASSLSLKPPKKKDKAREDK